MDGDILMGLYNILHGMNPAGLILLRALELRHHKLNPDGKWATGRFRDIHLSGEGDKIILFTRNGGGNRECWDYEGCGDASTPALHNPDCLVYINWDLTQHPHYIKDYDDDFDSTYASFEFKVPEILDKLLPLDKLLEAQGGPPRSFRERFMEVMDEIKSKSPEELEQDPRFKPLTEMVKKIAETAK
jgi:hypothetical protein